MVKIMRLLMVAFACGLSDGERFTRKAAQPAARMESMDVSSPRRVNRKSRKSTTRPQNAALHAPNPQECNIHLAGRALTPG